MATTKEEKSNPLDAVQFRSMKFYVPENNKEFHEEPDEDNEGGPSDNDEDNKDDKKEESKALAKCPKCGSTNVQEAVGYSGNWHCADCDKNFSEDELKSDKDNLIPQRGGKPINPSTNKPYPDTSEEFEKERDEYNKEKKYSNGYMYDSEGRRKKVSKYDKCPECGRTDCDGRITGVCEEDYKEGKTEWIEDEVKVKSKGPLDIIKMRGLGTNFDEGEEDVDTNKQARDKSIASDNEEDIRAGKKPRWPNVPDEPYMEKYDKSAESELKEGWKEIWGPKPKEWDTWSESERQAYIAKGQRG